MTQPPWRTSTRSKRLPPNWQTIRRKVRARAGGACQATHHAPGCNRRGTECDHIIAGDNHSLDNLQWLSHECHAAKTRQENANNNRKLAAMRRRPTEQHPGRTSIGAAREARANLRAPNEGWGDTPQPAGPPTAG